MAFSKTGEDSILRTPGYKRFSLASSQVAGGAGPHSWVLTESGDNYSNGARLHALQSESAVNAGDDRAPGIKHPNPRLKPARLFVDFADKSLALRKSRVLPGYLNKSDTAVAASRRLSIIFRNLERLAISMQSAR